MRSQIYFLILCGILLVLDTNLRSQNSDHLLGLVPKIAQDTLAAPGSHPFQLKASIFEGNDTTPIGKVEIYWVSPDKWRQTIESDNFSQTLVVNGEKTFENDSDDYFPLELKTLLTAMIDPEPILRAHRPVDQLETKANGASNESGLVCFGKGGTFCSNHSTGLMEIVGTPGQSVTFTSYRNFKGMRIARLLIDTVGVGEFLRAEVTELKEFQARADDDRFTITQPSPPEAQIHSVVLKESDLRNLAEASSELIWPQVLDGNTTGSASFYVSTDRTGRVREVLPVQTDNERSNDSARRQIMTWRFKPALKEGVPVQTESILTFAMNTRAWGPPDRLSDDEVRKLASNIVQPVFPPGKGLSGQSCSVRVAIDSDGTLIEAIPGDGVPGLFDICFGAVRQWHFSPFLQDGQPRPYRAEIRFQIP